MTSLPRPERSRWPGLAAQLTVLLLALLVVGPLLLGRGFALVGDMVFVPHQPWKDQWLGADGSVPRAVPVDAVVSLLTHVVAGDLLQKAVLLLIVAGAGWGMLRLLADCAPPARLAGAVLVCWNPFVYERFAIGQWALLCGYAALPWLVSASRRLRAGSGGWSAPTVWLALAAWTSPTGGVIAAGVLVAMLASHRRLVIRAAALGLLVNLPWLLPGALNGGAAGTGANGVAAFAATSDQPFGTVASVLSFGGMWKTSVAPDLEPAVLYAVLALGMALLGVVGVVLHLRGRGLGGLAAAALIGLVLALLPTTGFGRDLVSALIDHVPGAGILRDSQKWIAPYVVLVCAGLGLLVDRVLPRWRTAGLVALVPLLALPTLVWGLSGTWRLATYPADWTTVAHRLDVAGAGSGRTVVLPWSTYRRFTWAHGRAVLDPSFRFFPGEVLTSDDLPISNGVTVAGDSPAGRQIDRALAAGDLTSTLARLHVGWVVIEKNTPGSARVPAVEGTVLYDGPDLRLIETTGGASEVDGTVSNPRRYAIYGTDVAVLLVTLGVVTVGVRRRRLPAGMLRSGRSSHA